MEVAIKKITAQKSQSFEKLGCSFLNEVGIMSSISHPHCCQLLAACYKQDKSEFYFIMEKMSDNLANLKNLFSPGTLLEILDCVCKGMIYLHSRYV